MTAPEKIWAEPHSVSSLRAVLDYDPMTGLFKWKERSVEIAGAQREANRFNAKHAGKPALTSKSHGYLRSPVLGKALSAHRAAYIIYYGETPDFVDHINGDRSDNRIANLRAVDFSENARNAKRRADNTSGSTGVHFNKRKKKWHAFIAQDGNQVSLGYFHDKTLAIAARKEAETRNGFHENHGR